MIGYSSGGDLLKSLKILLHMGLSMPFQSRGTMRSPVAEFFWYEFQIFYH